MAIFLKRVISVPGSNKFTPIPLGQYSKPVQLKKNLIFPNAISYGINDYGEVLSATNLVDISTINNQNGAPTGVPANGGMSINQFALHKAEWYNVKYYEIMFDLDGVYNLDYAYIWMEGDKNGIVTLMGSEDGTTLKTLFPPTGHLAEGTWRKLEFEENNKGGNRYFIIGTSSPDQHINAIVLYGREAGTKLNHGVKLARKIPSRKINQSIGTNGFYFEHPELMATVTGATRCYVEPDWFMGDAFRTTGSATGKHPNDINYKFNSSHMGSIDQYLQGFKNAGMRVMFTTVNSPVCLRPIGTPDAGQSKAVDPGFSSKRLADTTNPMNYRFIARIGWNIAARYGANKNVNTQYINLQPNQPLRVGLDHIYCMEIGNEMDKWWKGEQAYHNPEEMAAYASALYDGHKGAMGPGYGIRDADPSMKVSMVSLAAGDNYAYIRRMLWWFDKYRGKGDYPFNVINYHWYNSSEGSQTVETDTAVGLPPEQGSLMEINRGWSDLRDTYCQSVEVWLTEVGWDEHLGGVFSPNFGTQFERSRYKAYWLTRLFICNEMSGVDVTNQYWYASTGGTRLEDLNQYEPIKDKFTSSALVDGVQSTDDWNRKPLMSYWYVATLKTILTGYYYTHTIIKRGVRNTYQTIINSDSANIWAASYVDYFNNKSYIVIWLDSTEMKRMTIDLNIPESLVKVIKMDEAEIRKDIVGVTELINTVNGKLTVELREVPIFIETSGIGTPMVYQPEDFKIQELSDRNMFLTWTDRNVDKVDTVIRQSETATGGYIVIFQGLIDDAQYVAGNLDISKNYYFKVNTVPYGSPLEPDEPPVGSDFDTALNTYELLAGSVYYAANSVKYGTPNSAVNNDSVGRILDKKGLYDLIYDGVPEPAVIGRPPILTTSNVLRPYITFENVPNHCYVTGEFKNPDQTNKYIYYPHAMTFVLQSLPGQSYEAWVSNYPSRNYLGEAGGQIRAGGAGNEFVIPNSTAPRFFRRDVMHVEYARDYISVWLNGQYQGRVPNPLPEGSGNSYSIAKIINALGTPTNSCNFNWFASYIWYTDQFATLQINRDNILASIGSKWLGGQMELKPYATNINTVFNPSTRQWSSTFDAINATQQDIFNTKYKWFIRVATTEGGGGGFAPQYLISTNAILNESDYAQYIPTGVSISCYVNVGDAWMYIKGPAIYL